VQVEIGTAHGPQAMRLSFTDQRLTAHGGMVVWSQFLHQSAFRTQLAQVLPPAPKSNRAYDPTDVALGFLGGILSGADVHVRTLLRGHQLPWARQYRGQNQRPRDESITALVHDAPG